jgi:hypothetical protein
LVTAPASRPQRFAVTLPLLEPRNAEPTPGFEPGAASLQGELPPAVSD